MTNLTIQGLPSELLVAIFLHLNPLSAIKCRAVCKDWEALGKSKLFMRALCHQVGFLLPGQTLDSLRKPKRRLRHSHLSWSHIHSQGELMGLRVKDLASYDVFFSTTWQLLSAWPTARFSAEVSRSSSAPTTPEVEATFHAAAENHKSNVSTSSSPSGATDRPSLTKMYSTALRGGAFAPETAWYDRADDCLVTSLDQYKPDKSGVAVIDARTGGLLSLHRRSGARCSIDFQLLLSDGWIVYSTGHNELEIYRFERLLRSIEQPRRGFLRKFGTLQSPHRIKACRFHFPIIVATTDDYHCLVYDVPKKVLIQDIPLKHLPLSPQRPSWPLPRLSLDFDEDYLYIIANQKSDQGATNDTGFLQIYARKNGSCLWTCTAATLLSMSSTLSLKSPGKDRSWVSSYGSRWFPLPIRQVPLAHQPDLTCDSGLLAVRYDKRSASLYLLGRHHLFFICNFKAKCRAAVTSGQQDDSDFGSSLAIVCIHKGPGESIVDQLAVYDGRVAFVVGMALVIVDTDVIARSAKNDVGQLGLSAAYAYRLSELRFNEFSTLQMDATCLTAVASFNGVLLRPARDLTDGSEAPNNSDQGTNVSWEKELAGPSDYDHTVPPTETILVFDFGQLSRRLRSARARAPTGDKPKGAILCYPSGQTLSRLQRSGHMVMRPYGPFDEYSDDELSTDEEELLAIIGDHGPE